MVIVTGEIRVRPEDVAHLRAAAIVMMDETAKEPGCRFYRFYEDVGRPGHLRVYEEWDSEEALHAHMATPHMKAWRAALGQIEVLDRKITLLRGAHASDL